MLCQVYPRADIPIVQLSIDETRPASFHYDIGQRLAPLREEGILIVGSGNLVHNLHTYAWGQHAVDPFAGRPDSNRRSAGSFSRGITVP